MLADTEYVKLLFSIQEKEFDLDNMGMIPYLRANLVKKIFCKNLNLCHCSYHNLSSIF